MCALYTALKITHEGINIPFNRTINKDTGYHFVYQCASSLGRNFFFSSFFNWIFHVAGMTTSQQQTLVLKYNFWTTRGERTAFSVVHCIPVPEWPWCYERESRGRMLRFEDIVHIFHSLTKPGGEVKPFAILPKEKGKRNNTRPCWIYKSCKETMMYTTGRP